MINQIYYPKYNIILINSNNIFSEAFVCFLDNIYNIPYVTPKETKIILNDCLYTYFFDILKNISVSHKQYNNVVFFYNFTMQDYNADIFKYICKDKFTSIIKQFILKNKNTFNFFKNNKNIHFNTCLKPRVKITGEELEILNAINKKLTPKPTLT
jgi:hypothetical protein